MENWKRIHPDTHTPLRGTLYSLEPSPRARPPTRAARRTRERSEREPCRVRCRWSPLGFRDYTTVRHARRDPVPEPDWDRLRERDAQHTWLMGAACSAWTRRRREWRDPRPDRESGAGRGPRARCRAVPTAHPTDSVRHRRGPQAHSSATLERNYYRTRAAAGRRRIQKCKNSRTNPNAAPPPTGDESNHRIRNLSLSFFTSSDTL